MTEEAAIIADNYLACNNNRKWVLLSDIAEEINSKMRKRRHWKRKEQLHGSLYDYEQYVDNVKWVPAEELTGLVKGLGGKFLCVENHHYTGDR